MSMDWNMTCGFTDEEAKLEASRCLCCKNPSCEKGCPAGIHIRDFIKEIKNGNLKQANEIIYESSTLPYICSIVCPHERQCAGHCILGVKRTPIHCGKLERYVVEKISSTSKIEGQSQKRVAIVGAGPAGISCAIELAKKGVQVEIFENASHIGGIMTYGIPSYRLEFSKIDQISSELKRLKVKIHLNSKMNESGIIKLKETFDAVFIANGLMTSKQLGIPKENIKGSYDALDYLRKVNEDIKLGQEKHIKLTGRIVVIGAGNVAMDAARCAARDGAEVWVVYRRSRNEAPATKHEIACAEDEGVQFHFLKNPVEILGTEQVTGVRVEIMELGTPDSSGRRRPVGTGVYEEIACNGIIRAIGQDPENIYDKSILATDHNYLVCEDLKTNIDGIYAGGDIVLGAKTVVEAMVCGRKVAELILNQE